jgi:hypothetical protein
MGALRPLAIARDYAEMHAAFRAHVEQLNISRATIDHVTGWADGYAGKTLAPEAIRGMSRATLGPFLQSLGLVLIVAQDVDALARMRYRLPARNLSQVRYPLIAESAAT